MENNTQVSYFCRMSCNEKNAEINSIVEFIITKIGNSNIGYDEKNYIISVFFHFINANGIIKKPIDTLRAIHDILGIDAIIESKLVSLVYYYNILYERSKNIIK